MSDEDNFEKKKHAVKAMKVDSVLRHFWPIKLIIK